MDPDRHRTELPIRTVDDHQLGALVRSVADDWRMPPQGISQPTWRDRVHEGRSERRGWLGRFAGPAAAALVTTVAVAFVAVWLTSARSQVGGSTSPDPNVVSPGPSASPGSTGSPLPKLVRNGDLPSPARVLVRLNGRYEIADLGSGTLAPASIATYTGPTSVLAAPGGGWVCVCSNWIEQGSSAPTGVNISLDGVDRSGVQTATDPVRTLEGTADPKWARSYQMEVADVGSATWLGDGTVLVGWSVKHGAAGWTSGIDTIDIASGVVIGTLDLPTRDPSVAHDWPLTRLAPRIALSPPGDRVLISSSWYVEDPSTSMLQSGTDHWSAPITSRSLGAPAPLDATSSEPCADVASEFIDASTWYAVCPAAGGTLEVARYRVDGQGVDRTQMGSVAAGMDAGAAIARSGDGLFAWDPVARALTRFDLQSAAVATATVPETAGSGSPMEDLAAFGRRVGDWLAPAALAKVLLEPAVVVSPDGTRVYALGVDPLAGGELGGSRGVYAFDAHTLQLVGHWPPVADYISLAVSPDGRFVYASGDGGRDSTAHPTPNGASITVYDTTDGSVRLIAGQLGQGELWFPGPLVQ